MLVTIRFRRGTAAEWTAANPILALAEPGFETDTGFLKVGDGVTAWNTLEYIQGESSGGTTGPITLADITDATDLGRAIAATGTAAGVRSLIGAEIAGHSVTAAQVSDATTAGKALLTAIDTAAQRTALGVSATADVIATSVTSTTRLRRNSGVVSRILEILNGAIVKFGIDGTDASPVVGDIKAQFGLHWFEGDADPTTNGPIPAGLHYTVHVSAAADLATVCPWVLEYPGFTVDRYEETGTPVLTYLFKWDGIGITDETAVTVGLAGTGDDPVDYLFSAAQPVVEATGVPSQFPTNARMVRHTAAATTPAEGFAVPAASTTITIRRFLRTPTSWPGAFPIISVKNGLGAGSDTARVIIGSTTSPGRISVNNSTGTAAFHSASGVLAVSSDYYVDLQLTLGATGLEGVARVVVRGLDGSIVFDSGEFTDDISSVGFGTQFDRVYFGPVANITTTEFGGRYAATADGVGSTLIPASA